MIRARARDPAALVPAVRRELGSLDRNVPVVSLMPFTLRMAATLERRRFSTLLLEIFAALAVALSSVGIYGILNYWMGMRQKEIAIRMALGARRSDLREPGFTTPILRAHPHACI
jgi:putative ABC transport system permease protein